MGLRTRLLVSYGYLATLVMLAAGSAAVGFFDVGRGIDQVVTENSRTVETTTKLLEALERQDSATLTALMEKSEGEKALAEANAEFDRKLEELVDRVSTDEEKGAIDRLRDDYATYERARTELLSESHEYPLRAYERTTFPEFEAVKQEVVELLDHQHQEMAKAGLGAREDAIRYGSWLGFLVVVALLSLVLLTRGLRSAVLDRLSNIHEVAQAVASGESHRRIRVQRHDELGIIAREFNETLDRLDELERNVEGDRAVMKRQLVALLEVGWGDVALHDTNSQLLATTFEGESESQRLYRNHRDTIVEAGDELLEDARNSEETGTASSTCEFSDGTVVELSVFTSPAGEVAGWIADLPSDA